MKDLMLENENYLFWFSVGKLRDALRRIRYKELSPHNITIRESSIIRAINNLGDNATLKEIAKDLDRGIGPVSITTQRMERDNLIKKKRANTRSTLLKFELTEKGIEAYKNAQTGQMIDKIISTISPEERDRTRLILDKLCTECNKVLTDTSA